MFAPTRRQIGVAWPLCPPAVLAAHFEPMVAGAHEAEVSTPLRWAMWLAQVGHESDQLRRLTENLNYSPEALVRTWPRRFPDMEAARPFARAPERLANRVYANRLGNRDEGDGWRYRGRGPIQLTGRSGYIRAGVATGLALEAHPELVELPEVGHRVAALFWRTRGINGPADLGDVEACTQLINGGQTGLDARQALYEVALKALGVTA